MPSSPEGGGATPSADPAPADDRAVLKRIALGGLCGTCAHARLVRSDRGSAFLRCVHPRTPRYPPQPLASCAYVQPVAAPPLR